MMVFKEKKVHLEQLETKVLLGTKETKESLVPKA